MRGAPRIEYSEKDRRKIRLMAGYGLRDEDISNIFDVSESHLKSHCNEELKKGRSQALCNVAKTLYKQAVRGDFPSSTIFYLKTRGKGQFKEVSYIQESTQKEEENKLDLTKLSKDELKSYLKLLKKAAP